jgi:hypothetical protein
VSVTAEGNFLNEETQMTLNILRAAHYVHGVFLDYDCGTNKDMFTQVGERCILVSCDDNCKSLNAWVLHN